MGFKDIVAGDYTAKAVKARYIKSPSKNTPGIEVTFEFKAGENTEHLNWVGWLSDAAKERTVDTLVHVLGSNGSEMVNADGYFTDPGFLDKDREVRIVVEMENYKNKEGEDKVAPRIQWVNTLGGSGFANTTPDTVKNDLGALGFRAAVLSAKQSVPPTATKKAPVSDESVPF